MPSTILTIATILLGLVAGVLGGLAGIGGSLVMLPALHLLHGEQSSATHHTYMAAAMAVNLIVALPAAKRHHELGSVRRDLLPWLMPGTAVAVVAGVLLSNTLPGQTLRLALAAFLILYCLHNLHRILQKPRPAPVNTSPTHPATLLLIALVAGMVAGLLGLGGGVVMVPMLQLFARVPLRQAIGTSSAVIVVTALIGASVKLASLPRADLPGALLLAALMAPGAVVGARLGASLTHRLPVRAVRIVVTLLLFAAAIRLAQADLKRWILPPPPPPSTATRV